MTVKKSDIEIIGDEGVFQLAIGGYCVTEDFKTKEACYKHYIAYLLNGIGKASAAMPSNTGF